MFSENACEDRQQLQDTNGKDLGRSRVPILDPSEGLASRAQNHRNDQSLRASMAAVKALVTSCLKCFTNFALVRPRDGDEARRLAVPPTNYVGMLTSASSLLVSLPVALSAPGVVLLAAPAGPSLPLPTAQRRLNKQEVVTKSLDVRLATY